MSTSDWRDRVPSRSETEQRAADESGPRRERVLDVLLGVFVVLVLLLLAWVVGLIGGEWS